MRVAALAWFFVFGGCALAPPPPPPPRAEPISIVAAELGPRGIRLVAIDEHGDRRFELIAPPQTMARDANPAVSPDGRWLVFASTRERSKAGEGVTSLWIAPVERNALPRRLTDSSSVDQHPVWARDG